MDFALTEEQQVLKRTAREFLAEKCPPELVQEMIDDRRGYPPKLWEQMARLGWQGLIIPADYGGSGGSFLDLVILLEEMGRACLPGPFFSTAAVAAPLILQAGSSDQKRALLPPFVRGELIVSLALIEPQSGFDPYSPQMTVNGSGELDGTRLFVNDAHVARYLICSARTENRAGSDPGITLYLIDTDREGVEIRLLKTMGAEKQCEVRFRGVKVSPRDIVGEPGEGKPVLERTFGTAAVAKCAELTGGAQRVLDLTTEYVKQREQSGRPIGGFQAIQHYCADMIRDVEGSRCITHKAAWEISRELPFFYSSDVAKAWVSDAYQRVALTAHQVFGGIGFCQEHPLHLYLKQSKLGELSFGDASYHREQVVGWLGI